MQELTVQTTDSRKLFQNLFYVCFVKT